MPRMLKLWGCLLGGASFTILLLALLAPIIQSVQGPPAGEALYSLLAHICHQYPTRSFWLFERPAALCIRCCAGYAGVTLGLVVLASGRRVTQPVLTGSILFVIGVLEPSFQVSSSYESSAIARLASGLTGGFGLFLILCPLAKNTRRNPDGRQTVIRTTAVFLIALLLGLAAPAEAKQVRLRNGTVVVVKTQEQYSSTFLDAGQEVVLIVAQPVTAEGHTLIEAGTPVIGFVDEADREDMAGKGGEIRISMRMTTAVDGSNVLLSGQMVGRGEDQIGRNVAIGVILCPFALLDKGGPGVIASGAETRALTIGELMIEVER